MDDFYYDFGYGDPGEYQAPMNDFYYDFGYNDPGEYQAPTNDFYYDFGYGDPNEYQADFGTVNLNNDYSRMIEEAAKKSPSTFANLGAGAKNIMNSLLGTARGVFMKKDAQGNDVVDWNMLTKAAAGVAGAYAGSQARENIQRVGYQGSIPRYTATRQAVQGTFDPNRRPGSSGQRYMTDVVFAGPGAGTVEAARAASQQQAEALQQANQANPAKQQAMASGGLAQTDAARYLRGETDGMADEIPSSIDGEQPAALSHGEFVIPADVVSHLGNGNSDAGAKKLYQMMDKIRVARTGTKEQGKQIDAESFMPGGLAAAYAAGGSVQKYQTGGEIKPTFESNLSNWAGPYVTDMLGRGAALSETPYQSYSGPLTAGASSLQQQAFQQAGQMPGLNYQPTQITGGTFGVEQAQQYMNPYLQGALNPQLDEARRQAEITRMSNAARLTKAGAYGGSRQAVIDAETQRNMAANMANITGQGYNTAFQNAMAQFNTDQARNMAAQQANEQSRQFGSGLGLQTLAQMGAMGQTQRDIEAQGIAADLAQFQEERDYPYKMLQFRQSLLQGLPLNTQGSTLPGTNTLQDASAGAVGVIDSLKKLGVIK